MQEETDTSQSNAAAMADADAEVDADACSFVSADSIHSWSSFAGLSEDSNLADRAIDRSIAEHMARQAAEEDAVCERRQATRACKYGRCPQHDRPLFPICHSSGPSSGFATLRCPLWKEQHGGKRLCWFSRRFQGDEGLLPSAVRTALHERRSTVAWQLQHGSRVA